MNENSVHQVFLSLGSNLGDRRANLSKAIELLIKDGCIILSESAVYLTSPLQFESENYFYNLCMIVDTIRNPLSFLELINEIQTVMGREGKTETYTDRIIDLDILYYDDLIFQNEDLIIPHPKISGRMFVLKPLAEIAPEKSHPILNKTVKELEAHCNDKSYVKRLS